jgi:hypothetical protein
MHDRLLVAEQIVGDYALLPDSEHLPPYELAGVPGAVDTYILIELTMGENIVSANELTNPSCRRLVSE